MKRYFKYILDLLSPSKLALCVLLIFLWTLFETLSLYSLKFFIDSKYFQSLDETIKFSLIFLGLTLAVEFIIRLADYIMISMSYNITYYLREDLTKQLLTKKSLLFFLETKPGELASRILESANNMEIFVRTLLFGFVSGSFGFFITVLCIINYPQIFLYFLLWYLLMLGTTLLSIKKIMSLSEEFEKQQSRTLGEIIEVFHNIIIVKGLLKENYETSRLANFYKFTADKRRALDIFIYKINILRGILFFLLLAILLITLISNFVDEVITLGDFIFIISSALTARREIWRVSIQLAELYKHLGLQSLNMIYNNPQAPINISYVLKNITFEAAWLNINNKDILQDINLTIEQGDKVAIIGPSGAGKTSFIKLLLTLYQPSHGKVMMNNKYSSNLDLSQVAYIPQEPSLFGRSIIDNIIYGSNSVDLKKVELVADIALCRDFIEQLPNKYGAILSNLGHNLSVGQRQRIAIARALYSDTPWLILDEPSAALDPINETQLMDNLLNFCVDKTLIIVTHNPNILRKLSRALVFEDGKLTANNYNLNNNQYYKNFVS